MDFSEPGVSEQQYNSFSDNEKTLFDIVASNGNASMDKLKEETGLSFTDLKDAAERLANKGVAIRFNWGSTGSILHGFRYSPYARDYEIRKIKNKGESEMSVKRWGTIEDKSWESVVNYLNQRMAGIRQYDGKFNMKNEELYLLKKAMQEVDPTIENVGATFNEHEHAGYDAGEGDK